MKRLAIYVHNDSAGRVQDYIIHCLKGLQEVVNEILVVVNGNISYEGRRKLESLNVGILVRDNIGFDWSGWKAGIEYYGYDKIAEYDDLLLTNNTFYGPVYPFSEMWDEMDKRDCDFWGINKHPKLNYLFDANIPESTMLEHIQSYWLVFRNRLLKAPEFKEYWEKQKVHTNYSEMVGLGETKLTNYFENRGFKSECYIDFEKYRDLINSNPTFLTYKQVVEDRSPIIKRKYFMYNVITGISELVVGYQPRKLLDFLEKEKLYDTKLIWQDLLSNHHLSKINDNLNLNYILPSELAYPAKPEVYKKTALVALITHLDLVDYCFSYIKNLPSEVDVFIVTTTEEVKKECLRIFSQISNKVKVRLQENRGRDNAALFITCRDVIADYEYLCFVHSKKSVHVKPAIQGEEFRNHNFISLLDTPEYIRNIIETFERNPRLGMFIPFPFRSRDYNMQGGNEWGGNLENTKNFFKKFLKIDDFDFDPDLIAPLGGMFWTRTKALKTITGYEWKKEDFPKEPLSRTNGLLTHAIERSFCLCAQLDGFYSSYGAPDTYAQTYLNNLMRFFREVKKIMLPVFGHPYCDNVFLQKLRNLTPVTRCLAGNSSSGYQSDYLKKCKRRYKRYRLLSNLTFGKLRKKFKALRKQYKMVLKASGKLK